MNNIEIDTKQADTAEGISLKAITILMYAFSLLSCFLGFLGIVSIIINYIKFNASIGTIYESHFLWLRRTFWFGILWTIVGFIFLIFYFGFFILLANGIWILYRVIRGFILAIENKPIVFKKTTVKSLMAINRQ